MTPQWQGEGCSSSLSGSKSPFLKRSLCLLFSHFPALTFLVHRYFSLLSMWLIVTTKLAVLLQLQKSSHSLERCRVNWLHLRTRHLCIRPVLGCSVWLSSVEARQCRMCWFPPGIQRQEVVWVASLWWPWCPRVQIDTSQGNSKPGNRCECVWRLTLHKIPNLILCLSLMTRADRSYFHLHHRC